jgi:signal transduction histidine kinase
LRSQSLCAVAQDVLLQSVLVSPRRRLAGGSDASDATRSFAREVGHELSRPLTTLWNRIEVMLAELRSGEPPADILGDLETLCRQAAQMAATVKGLLCISGQPVLELHPVDLNVLVQDTLSSAIPRLARRQVDVKCHLDRTVAPVLGDGNALGYALTVLIDTAAETVNTVHVTTRGSANGDVRVSIGTDRESPVVRDITPEDPVRLGLAAAIVRGLGGRIEQRGGNPSRTFVISLRGAGIHRPADAVSVH